MKNKIILSLLLMLIGIVGINAAEVTEKLTFGSGSSFNYTSDATESQVKVTAAGTNYSSRRITFTANTEGIVTVSSDSKTITKIVFTWRGTKYVPGDGDFTANTGSISLSGTASTWTGSASSVAFTHPSSSDNSSMAITGMTVTYTTDDAPATKQDITMSFPSASYTATLGEAFASPALSVSVQGLNIDYSSSNTKVATVAQDGTVTLVGAGSTTIKAAFAGDDNYNANSASYNLTVNEKQTDPDTPDTPTTGTTETLSSNDKTLSGSDNCTIQQTGGASFSSNRIKMPKGNEGGFTITSKSKKIVKVEITFSSNPDEGNFTASTGSFTKYPTVWESSTGVDEVTFTNDGTSQIYVTQLIITYSDDAISDDDNKKDDPEPSLDKEDVTMSFPSASYTATLGSTFDAPALTTDPAGIDVTYSSGNTAVATVDASTGVVTLVSAGQTIITASFDGNDTYNANSASYILNVKDIDIPVVEGTTWDFTAIPDADLTAMSKDADNWIYDATGSRYGKIKATSNAELTANGTALTSTKGLKFTAGASSSTTDVGKAKLRLCNKSDNESLQLNGSGITVAIPVKKGNTITVTAKSGNSTDTNRYLSITNATATSGFVAASAGYHTWTDNVATATADGYATIKTENGGINIQKITVTGSSTQPTEPTHTSAKVTPASEGTPNSDVTTNAASRDNTQNQLKVTSEGTAHYYNTADLTNVNVDKENGEVTITTKKGTDKYYGSATNIAFVKATSKTTPVDIKGSITITEAKGWNESAYIKWTPISGAESYHVYVKGGQYADYTKIDQQLVRKYASYGRADAVGLRKGTYSMKVVAVDANGNEVTSSYGEATGLDVRNYDRTGYAHFNHSAGIGAYNNDGTLKDNAIVLYVTDQNFSTITYDMKTSAKGTETRTGLGLILQALEKGQETRPIDVRIIGEIKVADQQSTQLIGEASCLMIKGKSVDNEVNVTIEGIGDDATMNGIGIRFNHGSGVEVRNLGIMNQADDCFELTQSNRMWIHNIDMFYGNQGSDKDQAKGDGSTDTKKGSTMQTFSFNHYWDSGKASLCGLSGESAENYITYHHNWFDHSDSRHPRIRVKTVHIYNNYYDGNAKYGVGVTLGSSAFVEANYFRNCKFPMMSSLQGNDVYSGTSKRDPANNGTFSKESGGMIKAFNNKIVCTNNTTSYWPYGATTLLTKGNNVSASSLGVNTQQDFDAYEVTSRNQTVPSSVKTYVGGTTYNNFDTDASKIYTYTPDDADDVPSLVTSWYTGAGRMNHGDFTWTFSSSDDTNYSVDANLKSKLHSYSTSLVGFYEK